MAHMSLHLRDEPAELRGAALLDKIAMLLRIV
jgi:hypothetical protein